MANAAQNLGTQLSSYAYSQGNPLQRAVSTTIVTTKRTRPTETGDEATQYYQQLMASGGYTPEQAQQIVGQSQQGNVPGLGSTLGSHSSEAASDFSRQTSRRMPTSLQMNNPESPEIHRRRWTICIPTPSGSTCRTGHDSQDQAATDHRHEPQRFHRPQQAGALQQLRRPEYKARSEALPARSTPRRINSDLELSPNFATDAVNSAAEDVANVQQWRTRKTSSARMQRLVSGRSAYFASQQRGARRPDRPRRKRRPTRELARKQRGSGRRKRKPDSSSRAASTKVPPA